MDPRWRMERTIMEQLNTLFASLETALGLQAPQLKLAFKVTLTIIAFLIVWLILRQILFFVEKRMNFEDVSEVAFSR